MTPASLARLRWAAEQPPPPVPAGQLALGEPVEPQQPRPVVTAGEPEPLFSIEDIPRHPRARPTRQQTTADLMPADEYRRRLVACGNTPHMVATIIRAYRAHHPDA